MNFVMKVLISLNLNALMHITLKSESITINDRKIAQTVGEYALMNTLVLVQGVDCLDAVLSIEKWFITKCGRAHLSLFCDISR